MLPTLEQKIIQLDNHILGWNGYEYPNEACKKEDLQLRNWLQELRVRQRSCKTYADALRKVNPKTEQKIIEELITENEELKRQIELITEKRAATEEQSNGGKKNVCEDNN